MITSRKDDVWSVCMGIYITPSKYQLIYLIKLSQAMILFCRNKQNNNNNSNS